MKTIKVNTGFGYYVDQAGHTVMKAELPIGEHLLRDGFSYVEVANEEALAAITIYFDPADIAAAENERKIRTKIRQLAVDALKADGQLPADFKV